MKFLIRVSKEAMQTGVIPQYSLVAFKVNSRTIRVGTVFKADNENGSVKVQAYSGMSPVVLKKLGFNENQFLTISSSNFEKVISFE